MTSYSVSVVFLLLVPTVLRVSCQLCGDEEFDNIYDSLTKCVNTIGEFKKADTTIKDLENLFGTVKRNNFNESVNGMFKLREDLSNLKDNINLQSGQLSEYQAITNITTWRKLNETVSRQEDKISELEPQLARLEEQVQSQIVKVAQLINDWNDLKLNVSDREETLKQIDGLFENLKTSFGVHEDTFQKNIEKTDALEAAVNNTLSVNELLSTYFNSVTDTQTQLEARVNELAEQIQQISKPQLERVDDTICKGWTN